MKAVIIYDNTDYAKKAKATLETAAGQSREQLIWSVRVWLLDILKVRSLSELALRDAADAHLILLALRNARIVPETLQSWLEQWVAHRQVQDAALAVLGGLDDELISATSVPELSQFAQRNGLSLICRCEEPVADGSGPVGKTAAEDEQDIISNVLPRRSAIYLNGWGINE